ncbi:MAG: hypothetical protein ACJAWF_001363 [Candidatus Azotimanducaceae bacterium]
MPSDISWRFALFGSEAHVQSQNLPLYVTFASVTLLFIVLNLFVPRFADDYCFYAPQFDISSIGDIVASKYQIWTGRIVAMLLSHSFFSLGSMGLYLIAILNGFMFAMALVLAHHLIKSHGLTTESRSATYLGMAIFLCLLWFIPHRLGEITLWKTGAVQYFWSAVLGLMLLLPLLASLKQTNQWSPLPTSLYCLLSLIVGMWLENLSAGLWGVWLLIMIRNYIVTRQHPALWQISGFVCFSVGLATVALAPGNYVRADLIEDPIGLIERIGITAKRLFGYIHPLLILLWLASFIVHRIIRTENLKDRVEVSAWLALVGFGATMVLSFAPTHAFIGRAVFPLEFFLILSVMVILPLELASLFSRAASIGTLLLMTIWLLDYGITLQAYREVDRQTNQRLEIIELAKTAGMNRTIPLPPLYFSNDLTTAKESVNTGRYFARDLHPNPTHWLNTCYSTAMGINSVALATSPRY